MKKHILLVLCCMLLTIFVFVGCESTTDSSQFVGCESTTDSSQFVGCESTTDSSQDMQNNQEDSLEILDPPDVADVREIEVVNGAGLGITIRDEETIRSIYEKLKGVKGTKIGSNKGIYGCAYGITVYSENKEWTWTALGESSYMYEGGLYDLEDGKSFSELFDLIWQAYIDNRVYEEPLECAIPTVSSIGIDIQISSGDAEKILAVFNSAEWTFAEDGSVFQQIEEDYIFVVKSGADLYYQKSNGIIYDRSHGCYFYLSDEDKAFIDEVLQKGE